MPVVLITSDHKRAPGHPATPACCRETSLLLLCPSTFSATATAMN